MIPVVGYFLIGFSLFCHADDDQWFTLMTGDKRYIAGNHNKLKAMQRPVISNKGICSSNGALWTEISQNNG